MFADLRDKGFLVIRDALPPARIAELRDELSAHRSAGRMKPAGIGKGAGVEPSVRRDEILWLAAGHGLLRDMDAYRSRLNRELFLGLKSFEGHYAHYPPGGFYRRHLDRFRDDDARTVSVILYLNADWKEADGGKLRLHPVDGPIDVEPRAGTLVLFMSGEIEHEVLESRATRLSFAGWFKT